MDTQTWLKKGQFFEWMGQQIFWVQSEGPESKKPVLFLIHGFPTSCFDFHKIWDQLAVEYRLVTYDMIGFGYSDKPANWQYSVTQQGEIAQVLINQLQIKTLKVLAHDLGVSVAQELIARHEDKTLKAELQKVVFLNGGIFPETHYPILIQKLMLTPLGKVLVHVMGYSGFRKSLKRVCSEKLPEQDIQDAWQLLEHKKGRIRLAQLIHYIHDRRNNRTRWVGSLQNSTLPVSLVDGVDDPVSGGHLVDRFEELVPRGVTIRLPGLGHYPHLEDAPTTLAAILKVL